MMPTDLCPINVWVLQIIIGILIVINIITVVILIHHLYYHDKPQDAI
jgi:hypothetical protein